MSQDISQTTRRKRIGKLALLLAVLVFCWITLKQASERQQCKNARLAEMAWCPPSSDCHRALLEALRKC